MEQGVISRPSILLTATDSELQLASTFSLFLESSSASPSFEAGPTKPRQQSCLLCSAQQDEVSGQPWAVAVKPLGTSAGRLGDSHLQQWLTSHLVKAEGKSWR